MKKKRLLTMICVLASVFLGACQSDQELDAKATQIAAVIFATQTAEAPIDTPTPASTHTPTNTPVPTDTPTPTNTPTSTPTPTNTPTPTPVPTATPGAEGAGSDSQAEDTIALAKTSTRSSTPTPATSMVDTLPTAVPTPTPAAPQPTPAPSQQWVLVADSAADFPGPIQDRKWWYLWSEGRNNFRWQDMAEMPNSCYHSPNDMTLEICRDQITVDFRSRGDAALQWKAREGGTYRFEWDSSVVRGETTLWFYKHLDFVGDQGPGSELPFSAIVEDVIEWELFFWLPQYDTHYRVKVYKLQE